MDFSEKYKTSLIFISKAILIALLFVFIVRYFFVDSITISSTQMETALMKGDKVFVDKMAYGIRLPITFATIPFTFDSIMGVKSYSSAVSLGYHRLGNSAVKRSDIVLFNNPSELAKPIDKRSLLISRCVAVPKDSLIFKDGILSINGKNYLQSPDLIQEYRVKIQDAYLSKSQQVLSVLKHYNIPLRNYQISEGYISFEMSRYEAFILNQNLDVRQQAEVHNVNKDISYEFIVPYKDFKVSVNESTLAIYGQSMIEEQKGKAEIVDSSLFIDGIVQSEYVFLNDYYWMISDNRIYSVDSYLIGFIPISHIVGRINYIWSVSDKRQGEFNRIIRREN